MKKYYGFVYISTNSLNGKKYIGQCSGDPDNTVVKRYFGSGKAISRAIKKNGLGVFTKEIVGWANSLEELNLLERQIIAEHNAVLSRDYYNIAPGGRASLGFTGKKHSEERNAKLSTNMLSKPHHNATAFSLDGKTYFSKSAAVRDTKYSTGKIEKFLKFGIHPADQIHGHIGKPKKYMSTAKEWELMTEEGKIFRVRGLQPWCRENGLNHHYIVKSAERGFYCGYKLLGQINHT